MMRSANPVPAAMLACSACAGDYEDPERTAWNDAREDDGAEEASVDQAQQGVQRDEFPVRKE
jgi:hypothetical protein